MGCGASNQQVKVPTPKTEPEPDLDDNSGPPAFVTEKTEVVPTHDYKQLHSAVRWNKPVAEIEILLTSKEAVNSVDPSNGNRLIHIAAQNGHVDIVKLLIKKKADLNAENLKGNTALHMSIGYDYYEASQLLLNAGADPNFVNQSGFPAKIGLEGKKGLGIAALGVAKTPAEVIKAFDLCETIIEHLDRANFAQNGLKAKKTLGADWTPELQNRFKEITSRIQ